MSENSLEKKNQNSMQNNKKKQYVEIRFSSFDYEKLNVLLKKITDLIKTIGGRVTGVIFLPCKRHLRTLRRSPFIYKKSRQQFELKTHVRLLRIKQRNKDVSLSKILASLNNIVVPTSITIMINMI